MPFLLCDAIPRPHPILPLYITTPPTHQEQRETRTGNSNGWTDYFGIIKTKIQHYSTGRMEDIGLTFFLLSYFAILDFPFLVIFFFFSFYILHGTGTIG